MFSLNGDVFKVVVNEVGFYRFDVVFGFLFFYGIYVVFLLSFGVFFSLYVVWFVVILVSGFWINEKFVMFYVVWIIWVVFYLNYYYGVDVVGGIFLVFLVNFMMRKVWCLFFFENGKKLFCYLCRSMSLFLL